MSESSASARNPSTPELERRLGHLERGLQQMRTEVRTRRLVVTDSAGAERLVAEVRGSTMELRLMTGPSGDGSRPTAILYVTDGGPGPRGSIVLGPAVGLQLWAEGDAVVELDAWPSEDGSWHPHLHLGGAG